MITADSFRCQNDNRFAAEKGCAPPRFWAARLPWGIDLLAGAFWNGRNRTLCEWFVEKAELSGSTHEQRLRKW